MGTPFSIQSSTYSGTFILCECTLNLSWHIENTKLQLTIIVKKNTYVHVYIDYNIEHNVTREITREVNRRLGCWSCLPWSTGISVQVSSVAPPRGEPVTTWPEISGWALELKQFFGVVVLYPFWPTFLYNDVCLGFQQSAVLLDDFISTESDVWGNTRKPVFDWMNLIRAEKRPQYCNACVLRNFASFVD